MPRSTIAAYAFTTLNPVVSVVRVAEDGSILGGGYGTVYDEMVTSKQREKEPVERCGTFADIPTTGREETPMKRSDSAYRKRVGQSQARTLVSAIYGTLSYAHLRCRSSGDELRMLREEVEKYKIRMANRAQMVIVNELVLLVTEGDRDEVQSARAKLARG